MNMPSEVWVPSLRRERLEKGESGGSESVVSEWWAIIYLYKSLKEIKRYEEHAEHWKQLKKERETTTKQRGS